MVSHHRWPQSLNVGTLFISFLLPVIQIPLLLIFRFHLFVWPFFFFSGGRVELSPLLLRPLNGLSYQPRMMDDDECGALCRMIGKGNRSTQRKPASLPFCLPQIPHDLTRTWTLAASVGSWWLTTWAMLWPLYDLSFRLPPSIVTNRINTCWNVLHKRNLFLL
jgi:hypothetical protein